MSAERLQWYWHRIKAMRAEEIHAHIRKKRLQLADGFFGPVLLDPGQPTPGVFPHFNQSSAVPDAVLAGLSADLPRLLSGNWRAFGHIDLKVDLPPRWQMDYLAGEELQTRTVAFRLNHRKLPGKSDIKLVWELSRWGHLVRLSQAARLLNQPAAAELVLRCLENWVQENPAFRGWNWTSALEAGIRLIQFCWIESLLGEKTVASLAGQILPAHVQYAWRHKSFGSSANNHLLGELTGLILAVARRPSLSALSANLLELQVLWETEVLRQFHPDGGNVEQALNYHLFSFEFCWQARLALLSAGCRISPEVDERLQLAVDFLTSIQVDAEPWDYGDSDSAWVTPVASNEVQTTEEWLAWANGTDAGASVRFWMGDPLPPHPQPRCVPLPAGGLHFPESGLACWSLVDWNLRWDVSRLGYLATAAHGHLDALHVSLWFRDLALVIDPGTGAYYGDRKLRNHLASWKAHNGPVPLGLDFPSRRGPFLWAEHHPLPEIDWTYGDSVRARLRHPTGVSERTISWLKDENGWQVDDDFVPNDSKAGSSFEVRWQFAPGWKVEQVHERMFIFSKQDVRIEVGLDAAWKSVEFLPEPVETGSPYFHEGDFKGVCSPRFREVRRGPRLRLVARGHNPCLFRTTFLASRGA